MTCALCKFFTLKNLPAGAVDGEGQCLGYLESLRELVAWDRPRCGLFRSAKSKADRENWVTARIARLGDAARTADPPPLSTTDGPRPSRK